MLIVLQDEPGLFVFPTLDAAMIGIEWQDVDAGIIRAAFDERAVPYRIEWLEPVRRTLFFGLFSTMESQYRFVPSGPPDHAGLVRLLEEHPNFTHPPEAKDELASLLSELRAGFL